MGMQASTRRQGCRSGKREVRLRQWIGALVTTAAVLGGAPAAAQPAAGEWEFAIVPYLVAAGITAR